MQIKSKVLENVHISIKIVIYSLYFLHVVKEKALCTLARGLRGIIFLFFKSMNIINKPLYLHYVAKEIRKCSKIENAMKREAATLYF